MFRAEIFRKTINEIAKRCHKIARKKGWWDQDRNNGELIALMHSEASELLEAYRKDPDRKDEHCPEFKNTEIECADLVIRVMDFAHARELDLGGAMMAKMKFNKSRPRKHGKKF